MSKKNHYGFDKTFGNLKVRPKLMVLHNLFFLVLTCAAYFSLIPLFEKLVSDARAREVSIVHQTASISAEPTAVDQLKQSQRSYDQALDRAKLTLFLVLGSIYVLAVFVLESAIMLYPVLCHTIVALRRMLHADTATQTGDRERELIPPEDILGDEIGLQIMRSRNETVATLRRREDEL